MQAKETAIHHDPCCQIVDIGRIGSRVSGYRRKGRMDSLDRKFEELDQRSRLHIVHTVIGYCRAMSDGIKEGRESRNNEISGIVKAIEESINEEWKGGMI